MEWSLDEYCASQPVANWDLLPESSRLFLEKLSLSSVHPFCEHPSLYHDSNIPPMGPMLADVHDTVFQALVTYYFTNVPPLVAFINLWFRLLSGVAAPVGLLFLMWDEQKSMLSLKGEFSDCFVTRISLVAVICSMVIIVDSMYVYEYGTYGITIFIASLLLAVRACLRRQLWSTYRVLCLVAFIAFLLTWNPRTKGFQFGDPFDVDIQVKPGLYYETRNKFINDIIANWPKQKRTYSRTTGATPWLYTGDGRTGLPFFLNSVPIPLLNRVFLPLDDGEVLALDVAFPELGHNKVNPVYLILHGVNGGSSEGYATDLVHRRIAAGSTVVVMVSRGLMDVPIRGWDFFHGARWTDAHATATAVRRAIEPDQILAGVGFSMGAIVLNLYVASSGEDCALDAAFSISGALECRHEAMFNRTKFMWQPMIAEDIRSSQHLLKWGERMKSRLSKEDMIAMMRVTNVVELDRYTSVKYNGFRDLEDFYSRMGALGDVTLKDLQGPLENIKQARILNVSIPLCVMHSFDDPISTWRTIVGNEGFMRPENLVRSGKGNLILLLTETGGHVGWPIGWLSSRNNWVFMNEAAASFVDAVNQARVTNQSKGAQRQ